MTNINSYKYIENIADSTIVFLLSALIIAKQDLHFIINLVGYLIFGEY